MENCHKNLKEKEKDRQRGKKSEQEYRQTGIKKCVIKLCEKGRQRDR